MTGGASEFEHQPASASAEFRAETEALTGLRLDAISLPAEAEIPPSSRIAEVKLTHPDGFQPVVAHLLGVSKRTLQGWEQGRKQPSGAARTLLAIAARRPEMLREVMHVDIHPTT